MTLKNLCDLKEYDCIVCRDDNSRSTDARAGKWLSIAVVLEFLSEKEAHVIWFSNICNAAYGDSDDRFHYYSSKVNLEHFKKHLGPDKSEGLHYYEFIKNENS